MKFRQSILLLFAAIGVCLFHTAALSDWNQNYESNVFPLWDPPYELSGAGYKLGLWAGGSVDTAHPEIAGRISLVDSDVGNIELGTHLAGVMVATGVNPSEPLLARGPAYQATLLSWSFDDFANEFVDAINNGVVTSNNPWGFLMGYWYDPFPNGIQPPGWRNEDNEGLFGAYVNETQLIDDLIFQAEDFGVPFVVTFPVGDDRDEGIGIQTTQHDGLYFPSYPESNPYFKCINPIASGKNTISVGATRDLMRVTTSTSFGPTEDGRIKPDLVARGEQIYSLQAGTFGYANASGTAQAAAFVNAVSVLVMEQYARNFGQNPGVATIKALLANFAVDAGPAGPDPLYGFGIVDVQPAIDTLVFDGAARTLIKEDSVADGAVVSYDMLVLPDNEELRLTLSWIDPPGSTSATNAIVNDLDLELVDPLAQTHYPFRLSAANPTALATASGPNPVDTVEQLVVDNPAAGLWTVRVKGSDVPVSGPQNYSIASNTPINAGAAEPASILFERNGDGSSVDISWDPVTDPDLVEFRIFRSSDISNELELVATVPAGTSVYTDIPPSVSLLGYDVRSVYDRDGARVISTRPFGLQTPTPVIDRPIQSSVLPDGGTTTRIVGRAKRFGTLQLYEVGSPLPFATVTPDTDGKFWLDHDFGGPGPYSIYAQNDWFFEGISIPSLEVDFQIVP